MSSQWIIRRHKPVKNSHSKIFINKCQFYYFEDKELLPENRINNWSPWSSNKQRSEIWSLNNCHTEKFWINDHERIPTLILKLFVVLWGRYRPYIQNLWLISWGSKSPRLHYYIFSPDLRINHGFLLVIDKRVHQETLFYELLPLWLFILQVPVVVIRHNNSIRIIRQLHYEAIIVAHHSPSLNSPRWGENQDLLFFQLA